MRKDLDSNGLIYYSYQDSITGLSDKVDFNRNELENKINDNINLINKNTSEIQNTNSNVEDVDNKVNDLKIDLENKPTYPITSINNVNQYVYKNIKSGDTIEIPNNGKDTNYLIECYTQIDAGVEVECASIDINPSNKDKLIYDENYVDIDNDGAKPKDSILLKLNKTQLIIGSETINVYESEVIPEEIVDRFESILSIDEQMGVI
jgi:hypothetical protein